MGTGALRRVPKLSMTDLILKHLSDRFGERLSEVLRCEKRAMFGERASSRGKEIKEVVKIHAICGRNAGGAQNRGKPCRTRES
jgi:hypothetical protein